MISMFHFIIIHLYCGHELDILNEISGLINITTIDLIGNSWFDF